MSDAPFVRLVFSTLITLEMATTCTLGQDKEWQETLVVEGKEQNLNLLEKLLLPILAHPTIFPFPHPLSPPPAGTNR